MKIGKVIERLQNNSKVEAIKFHTPVQDRAVTAVEVFLKDGFKNGGERKMLCSSAKEADTFIRGAKKVEALKPEMKEVTNLMSGKKILIPSDTHRCCDPSTELYWSM
jgi:hypothetical protein